MTTLTYDQAVKTYKARAAKLEKNYQSLVSDINLFLKSVKGYVEKKEHKADEAKLQDLEQQLKEM